MRLHHIIVSVLLISLFITPAFAMKLQVKMNQQGVLLDNTGAPYNGPVTIECRVYDDSTGGNLLHVEPGFSQTIAGGLFNLTLGDEGIPVDPDVFASDADSGDVVRYIEMHVNGETLSPRTPLIATPYAVAAHRLAGDVQTMPGQLDLESPTDPGTPAIRLAADSIRSILDCRNLPPNGASGPVASFQAFADAVLGSELKVDVSEAGGIVPCVRITADPLSGSSMQVDVNQPSGIIPCVRASADPVAGSELRVDVSQAGGINPCVRVAADPGTGSLILVDGNVAGGIVPCVRVAADPSVGSSIQVDYNQVSGILPCIRVASDPNGAVLNMSRSLASPFPVSASSAAAADSVSIEMVVDSNQAHMQLYAGNAALNTPIVFTADGNEARIGINTATPVAALEVNGDLCVTGSMDACSDVRYKRDIKPISGALDKLDAITGVEYKWRQDEFTHMKFNDRPQVGVLAHEVEEVLPMLVSTREDGYKAVDYTKLTAVLIEAVKELKAENEELRTRLDRMEGDGIATASR